MTLAYTDNTSEALSQSDVLSLVYVTYVDVITQNDN